MEELTELSKNISDSYPDFVIGVESAMKKNSMQAVERGNSIVKETADSLNEAVNITVEAIQIINQINTSSHEQS